jgi:hypothetical protein
MLVSTHSCGLSVNRLYPTHRKNKGKTLLQEESERSKDAVIALVQESPLIGKISREVTAPIPTVPLHTTTV